MIVRNNLKNREFGKKGLQKFCTDPSDHCQGQGATENGNFEGDPTRSKTDSSGCFGIDPDLYFMKEALKEAQKAFDADEVPVGAVLVYEQRVIARGYNQVELLQDATAHAEMICLTAGASFFKNWRLAKTTLYCTLEPCSMCAGAILLARVERLVWAAPDIRLGANGSWIDLFAQKHPMHSIEVTSHVLEEEAAFLMKNFFQKQRKRRSTTVSPKLFSER
jgi:tRNA(adenine34) deaminase